MNQILTIKKNVYDKKKVWAKEIWRQWKILNYGKRGVVYGFRKCPTYGKNVAVVIV